MIFFIKNNWNIELIKKVCYYLKVEGENRRGDLYDKKEK